MLYLNKLNFYPDKIHIKYQSHLKNKKIILNLKDINVIYSDKLLTLPQQDIYNFASKVSMAKLNYAYLCVKVKNLKQLT